MNRLKNYLSLKNLCRKSGVDLFGVADIRKIKNDFALPKRLSNRFSYAVCLGLRLSKGALLEIEDKPTPLYFQHYRNVNILLDQIALLLNNFIERKGYLSLPVPASQIIDWHKQIAHLSHKNIGFLAGLGWIGRNNLLVNKNLGSRFRLVSVLTDMPLKPDKPSDSGCGECRACVNACPAGAIKDSSKEFDHHACFRKIREFQKMDLIGHYICGVCIRVCAAGKKQDS